MNTLGTMLKQRRAVLGQSQEQAAVAIGTTRTTYQKWEDDTPPLPSAKWVEPLCEWLDAAQWRVLHALGLLDDETASFLGEHLGGYLAAAA